MSKQLGVHFSGIPGRFDFGFLMEIPEWISGKIVDGTPGWIFRLLSTVWRISLS